MTEMTDIIGKGRGTGRRLPVVRHDVAGRWAPPGAWVTMALLAGPYVPAWAWMWLIAVAVFAACKWATWWPLRFEGPAARRAGYLLAYAGMDAGAFILGPPPPAPRAGEWFVTATRALAGATLLAVAAGSALYTRPTVAGWTAMAGLVLLLHFGLLDLLALAWRAHGVNAQPLMRRPLRAASLADFWGRRWNTGFRSLAHELIFEPLRRDRHLGPTAATAAVFLASGAVHDLVISVPSRGGHGLPTLYFLLQFAGLALERNKWLRRRFARRAWLRRLFTVVFVVAPLPLLFHEPFVRNVILPFLNAIGGRS